MSSANKQEMCQYRKEVEKDILITYILLMDKNGILSSIQSICYLLHKSYTISSSKQYSVLKCLCVRDLVMQKDIVPSFFSHWLDVCVLRIWKCVGKYPEHRFHRPRGSARTTRRYGEARPASETQSVFHCSLLMLRIMTPRSALVDLVAVSSGSYPAVPDSVQPDFGNLRQGLLRPHLWILTTQKLLEAATV